MAGNRLEAEALLSPTHGNEARGGVHFLEKDGHVHVRVELIGLQPHGVHGFHIHEKGDCSAPDGMSAGGHFAPERKPHGLPPDEYRHAGDMGNLIADEEGRVSITEVFNNFSLEGDESVVGRAVIVHADPDQGVQPSGAAGPRIACGVIAR